MEAIVCLAVLGRLSLRLAVVVVAVAAAAESQLVVVVVVVGRKSSSTAADRSHLDLPPVDRALIGRNKRGYRRSFRRVEHVLRSVCRLGRDNGSSFVVVCVEITH